MTDSKRHSTPRADVLAEDYKGAYLWEQLDKARTRIADLVEQYGFLERELASTRANEESIRQHNTAIVKEATRLQEQLEALREAMLLDWRMNKVDDLDYETPDGWGFESHPWFSLLGLTVEDCITMLRGASFPATSLDKAEITQSYDASSPATGPSYDKHVDQPKADSQTRHNDASSPASRSES